MQYVIDTHALIWFFEDNARLSLQAKTVLSDPNSQLILPAIALAEAVWIVDRGKTTIPSSTAILTDVLGDSRIRIYPLDSTIIEQTITLNAIDEMHDRQIVATAIVLQNQGQPVMLISCDRTITASNLIPILW
jgi:PIN domain nuclease of toxin-antitoxin system